MLALLFSLLLNSASASPFRVLVFPHRGTYPVPQGQEAIVSRVTISSEETCNQFQAQRNGRNEWEKVGSSLSTQKVFNLTSTALKKKMRKMALPTEAFFFECTKPFTVHRGAGLEAYSYEGNFVALFDARGSGKEIKIVNLVDAEKYIQGVVPTEVGSGWPAEALKAQAVAARTFAWWTVLNEKGSLYDLNDTVEYQAYLGITRKTPATDSAVNDTSGQIMKYDGKVIKSYFSADSGGMTESALDYFGQNLPYCVSKVEQYDLSKTNTEWKVVKSLEEIGNAFKKNVALVTIADDARDSSGRVTEVTIFGADGQATRISGKNFRLALKLRSTFFEMKNVVVDGKKAVQIAGKGYGHGVGMAQVGAREYASQLGWTFDQILKFYYTGITIEQVSNEYTE